VHGAWVHLNSLPGLAPPPHLPATKFPWLQNKMRHRLIILALLAGAAPAAARQIVPYAPQALTAGDYSRAERRGDAADHGRHDFGYATNNAGWTRSDAPVVVCRVSI
jgi:hypothetical protein